MHKWYIFSQFVAPTCFGHFWPSSGRAVTRVLTWPPQSARTITQDILNTSTQLFNFLISIVNIQHDCWVLDDMYVNNCILFCVSHTVYYRTVNWRKSNQQMHCNWVYFLKIYLFINRTDMFLLFPSRHQGACYMVQRKNNVYIFQDTVINISVLQLQFITC